MNLNLDIATLAKNMLASMQVTLKNKWPEVKEYAESETKKLAETLILIKRLEIEGKVTPEQLRLHLEMQKNATRAVLLTIEGLGILAVEAAINAALNVVKDAVNTALGFTLL
ncbi:hypothetical protein [Candidatus Electronema sp. JM]|uniref:hypothetical protein n=1 Tax=Candidatus Electronema sp. JM TaxID=3401571 RepID=UPI003AA9C8B8